MTESIADDAVGAIAGAISELGFTEWAEVEHHPARGENPWAMTLLSSGGQAGESLIAERHPTREAAIAGGRRWADTIICLDEPDAGQRIALLAAETEGEA